MPLCRSKTCFVFLRRFRWLLAATASASSIHNASASSRRGCRSRALYIHFIGAARAFAMRLSLFCFPYWRDLTPTLGAEQMPLRPNLHYLKAVARYKIVNRAHAIYSKTRCAESSDHHTISDQIFKTISWLIEFWSYYYADCKKYETWYKSEKKWQFSWLKWIKRRVFNVRWIPKNIKII